MSFSNFFYTSLTKINKIHRKCTGLCFYFSKFFFTILTKINKPHRKCITIGLRFYFSNFFFTILTKINKTHRKSNWFSFLILKPSFSTFFYNSDKDQQNTQKIYWTFYTISDKDQLNTNNKSIHRHRTFLKIR